MKKYIWLLKSIWLSDKSAMIYLSLLEHGKSSIVDIQNDLSLHRVEIYRLLPYLIELGFVFVSLEWKRKYYSPANPEVINDIYREMQERNNSTIKVLQEKYSQIDKKPKILYSEWAKWIKHVFSDIVESQKKWDVFYRITSETDTEKINNEYLPKNYREKRDKKELQRYVIMSSKAAKIKNQRLDRDLIVVPEKYDLFDDNVFMSIYSDKVAYIDFNTETSIIIEDKQIARFQEKLFRMLYRSLKEKN